MSNNKSVAEDHSHDKVFVVTFLAVLGVLVGIAVVIGIVANMIDGDDEMSPLARERIAERLAPVGAVYTDAAQVAAAAPAVAAPAVARSAQQIYDAVCGACHNSGLLNAPKPGAAADWAARTKAAGGVKGLVASVINGKGAMPARGGDPSLSDEDIAKTVELMLK